MNILFDQGTPAPLRRAFQAHTVDTAFERGWSTLRNGELIDAAESAQYRVLVTTDRNLKYQQNLTGRAIAIVVLQTTSWPRIQHVVSRIVTAVENAEPGSYAEVEVP